MASSARSSLLFLVALMLPALMVMQASAQGPIVFPIKCTHPTSADGTQLSVECPFIAGSTTERNSSVCIPLCPRPDEVGRCKGRTCRCCTTGV